MIGSRLRQALALLLVPVFALGLLGGAYGFHGCPRHAAAGHGTPGTGAADAPRAAGAASGHRPAAVRPAAGEDGGRRDGPSCICVGSCHAGAAAVQLGPEGPGLPDPAPAAGPDSRLARAVPPHRTPAYFLPYSLGPPAA